VCEARTLLTHVTDGRTDRNCSVTHCDDSCHVIARIIEACARMHNYLLNCKEGEDEDSPKDEPEIHVM
jgi:hypothetical protein